MKSKKRLTKQLCSLINTWTPLVRAKPSLNQDLHQRAHLSALIRTMLSGKYPL